MLCQRVLHQALVPTASTRSILSRGYSSYPTTMSTATPLLITPQRLAALMNDSNQKVRVLDATWFMPNVKRDAHQEYMKGPRIPQSTFWDVEKVASTKEDIDADGSSLNPMGLGHMMPSDHKFAKAACE